MARKIVSSYAVFNNLSGTREIVFYYEGGGADSVSGLSAAEADFITDLLRKEKPVSYDHSLKRVSTWSPEEVGEGEALIDLDGWLNARPGIAAAIIWEDASGARSWASWSAASKAELRQAFNLARIRGSIPVAEVPPNQVTLAGNQTVVTVLSPSDAWAYFKASVAQSLSAETGKELPWSIESCSNVQLSQLFDSREMFKWNSTYRGYLIESMHGHLVPAPPGFVYNFLGTSGLIGNSRVQTIANVIDWCRTNLVHFTGGLEAANMEDQWQYRGFPPMFRVIKGTVMTSRPGDGTKHRTAGCWGTTGFFRALLRVINIPVKLVTNAGHAQPWFMSDSLYLTHGDDPYNQLTRARPPIPAELLLIDKVKFDLWFGSHVSSQQKKNNIGRRPRELAITYLPDYLLRAYCTDIRSGNNHENGKVYEIFSDIYTVQQLEAENLWSRMDAKIAGFGGCGNIP